MSSWASVSSPVASWLKLTEPCAIAWASLWQGCRSVRGRCSFSDAIFDEQDEYGIGVKKLMKKKPAAAQFMTRVKVKKMLDECEEKCLADLQDLKRELMGTMVQNHDQTHSKLKRIHEGICNVEEELTKRDGIVAATPKDEISRNESNHVVMRVAGISRPRTTP
jgi:hypothetical protein